MQPLPCVMHPHAVCSLPAACFLCRLPEQNLHSRELLRPGVAGAAEQLDAAYQEVKDVVAVPRGLGYWGDMVVTLRNDDKMELRALPK